MAALNAVGSDRSAGQNVVWAAPAEVELDAPNGRFSLDGLPRAIGASFVTEVGEDDAGTLVNRLVRVVERVDRRAGPSEDALAQIGLPSRDARARGAEGLCPRCVQGRGRPRRPRNGGGDCRRMHA